MSEPAGPADELLGPRGTGDYAPRWASARQRINDGVLANGRPRTGRAEALLTAAWRDTLVSDVDGGGLDLRARALTNLASIAADRGRPADALRQFDDALTACAEAEALVGDEHGTAQVRRAALVNRAQTLAALGRAEDALRDLDAAGPVPEPAAEPVLAFRLHAARGDVLTRMGRLPEAEAEIRRALDLATNHEPRLAGAAHAALAAIAARTEDHATAGENLLLARDLHELTGDTAGRAGTDENLARLALRAGRVAEAQQRFAAAEAANERAGDPLGVARCRFGRAAVALRRARPRLAERLLAEASAVLAAAEETETLVECHLLRGYVTSVTRGWAAGEEAFIAARELCADIGAWHQAARADFLRAEVLFASTRITPRRRERTRRREAALGLALPSALAIEAFRHRFPPGPTRERWASTVTAPAMALVFRLVTALGWNRLAFELVEYLAATTSLRTTAVQAVPTTAALADTVLDPPGFALPADPPARRLPHAAAHADPSAVDPTLAVVFEPPPRLRLVPAGESALESFLDSAERLYRTTIRSAEEVSAW